MTARALRLTGALASGLLQVGTGLPVVHVDDGVELDIADLAVGVGLSVLGYDVRLQLEGDELVFVAPRQAVGLMRFRWPELPAPEWRGPEGRLRWAVFPRTLLASAMGRLELV